MQRAFRRFGPILALLLAFGGQGLLPGAGFRVLAESPMSGQGEAYVADPDAADDEPPAAQAPGTAAPAGSEKTAPPKVAAPAAPVAPLRTMTPYPAVSAPLPPARPFSGQAVQPPPQSQPPVAAERQEADTQASAEVEADPAPPPGMSVSREELEAEEAKAPEPTLVEKQTEAVNIACLKPALMEIIHKAGAHFGATPVITSGQRNRGRRGSFHRKCMAADFILPGIDRARLARYLRALPEAGGVGTYCHTKAVHIDIGDPRNWYQCGFRFRFAQR